MGELIRDRYELLEVIGKGGQGAVHKARDHQHDRLVAIKVRPVASEASRKALLSEAKVLLNLRPHPGLPLVREDFFEADRYFMVMDWVEGRSLSEVLADQGDPGLPFPKALGYLGQVASAINHLHAHDPPVVHKDVKPANIILGSGDRVVLVDFGLAHTGPGSSPMGTPGYSAPELASADQLTPAYDVYSLAATAYTLLTGKVPEGGTLSWEGLAPDLASTVEKAVRSGLTTDPASRPSSAGELVELLGPLPSGIVTFLLTDVGDSVRLWEQDPDAMAKALSRLDDIVDGTIEAHGGSIPKARGEGDSLVLVFPRATEALVAAVEIQKDLSREPWPTPAPLRVRMALHTGDAQPKRGDYFGPTINRAARLRGITHPGQITISAATEELVGDRLTEGISLKDLGLHQLRGLSRPERVFQVLHEDMPEDFAPLTSESGPTNNLPQQLTTFVGRDQELAWVDENIGERRLITLVGPGGAGKTRLALEVARRRAGEFLDGTWLVSLEALNEGDLVPGAVLSNLGVSERSGQSPVETVVEFLSDKKALVVLDNCEHLIDACAHLGTAVLKGCPEVRMIATSLSPLDIAGESLLRVPPLSLPSELTRSLDELQDSEAARLFVERARATNRSFELSEDDVPFLAEICAHLDGLPLLVELAAARANVLDLKQIRDRMSDRFRLLSSSKRSEMPRHQTVRALVDWAYELLDDEEALLFRRLSVFPGTFDIEAVEEVCADEELDEVEVLGILAQLIDKSMLTRVDFNGAGRYRMLETLRQYASEKLKQAEDEKLLRDRHLVRMGRIASEATAGMETLAQPDWLDLLDSHHDDLRMAISWALETQPVVALDLCLDLGTFWSVRGYWSEGRRWLTEALESNPTVPTRTRARALVLSGTLANSLGEHNVARGWWEESLGLARREGDKAAMAAALANLAKLAFQGGNLTEAHARYEETLALANEVGDQREMASSMRVLGTMAMRKGNFEEARILYAKARKLAEEVTDRRARAETNYALGELALLLEDFDESRRYLEDGLAMARELGDRRGIAGSLHDLGRLAAETGDTSQAEDLLTEALAIAEDLGDKRMIAHALTRLGELHTGYEPDKAETEYQRTLELRVSLEDQAGMAECLEGLAMIKANAGEELMAARMLGKADELRKVTGVLVPRTARSRLEKTIESLRSSLGPDALEAAMEAGRTEAIDALDLLDASEA